MWISHDFSRLKQPIVNILTNLHPQKNFVALDIDATVLNRGRYAEPVETGMFVRDVAVQNNLPVVYITAREESPQGRERTLRDLADVGIIDPLVLILRPSYVNTWAGISKFKASARAYVENTTSSVCIMNVGDQWTDIMPITDVEWQNLRTTFASQNLLFAQPSDDGGRRWSVKLREDN